MLNIYAQSMMIATRQSETPEARPQKPAQKQSPDQKQKPLRRHRWWGKS